MKLPYTPAAIPENEAWRLQSLRDLNVLDTLPEAEFDALVKVASLVCGAPISLLSLVDADRQWFKADVGLGAAQTPRDMAFCAHTILDDKVFEVSDTLLDERFAGNPLVQGAPDIRFYAGAPITLANGACVGTLCVIDRQPKKLTAMQIEVLQNLGVAAARALDARRILGAERKQAVTAAHDSAVQKAKVKQLKLETALQQANALAATVDIHAIVSEADRHGVITDCNDSFEKISGYTRDELIGQNHRIVNSGHHPKSFWDEMWQTISSGTPWRGEICNRAKSGQVYWVDSMIAPFIGDDGHIEKYVSIRTDITQRVREHQKFTELSLKLNLAIEGSNDGLWDWPDVSKEEQWWSPHYYTLLGYSEAELPPTRNSFLSVLHPEFVEDCRKANSDAIEGIRSMDVEVRLKTRDHGYRWFRIRAKAGLDAQGLATRMAGSTQDIHERKEYEQQLIESHKIANAAEIALGVERKRLNDIIEATRLGTWEWNVSTGDVVTNERWAEMLGYRLEELSPLTAQTVKRLTHPDDLPVTEKYLKQHWRQGTLYDCEIRMRHKDGHWVWVLSHGALSSRLEDGRPEWMSGTTLDISQRKYAEEALFRSNRRFEVAAQGAGIGVWEWDLSTKALTWDEQVYRLYGFDSQTPYSTFEILSRSHGPEATGRFESALRESVITKSPFIGDYPISWPDGSKHYLRTAAYPVVGDDGKVLKLIGVNFEISELVHAKEAAEQASESKGQFLANMSHEIRTPMNAILGLLELLQRTELTDRQRDYAVKTNGAARSLLGLLNDILDFSKVEAGKMTLENEPIQIDKLLRNISTILSANVGSKDIEVLFDIDAKLPAIVCGDAMRLQQVLINLGGNAVKFTSQGQVVLAIHKLSQSDNSVTIRFAVKDTGIGIAPEHQAHIFSGFSQAESSTTRKFGGTGLGLAISKRLVELMGGDIEITSTPGVGSTFAFEIELATVDTVSDAPLDSDSPVIQRQRVLVVDDNTVSGELTVGMIRSWGWTADLAKSGKQALEMVAHQEGSVGAPFPYPVIYMGWKMPDMDGWEVTLRIREIARVGNMPQPLVFMLSARGREALALRTEEEQDMINGFLVKPVTASMLFDVLAKASGGKTSVRKRSQGRSRTRQLVGMRILVVEDNLINQQVADELLTAHGAIVSLAANGQLGVDAVAAAAPQYDVVLMDIQMPVLDGYGATQAIRNELGLLDLPIVAMTANAMARDRDACIAAGMSDHIGKPFDIGKLVSLLIRITGLRPSQTTAEETASGPTEVHHLPEIAGLELQTAMNRMSGMRSLYVRTSRDFVRVMDTVIPELQQCLAEADMRKAKMRLHTLKGNAGTLGATELAAHAAKLEKLFSTDAGVQECEEALGGFEILVRSTQNMLSEAIAALELEAPNTSSVAANTPGQPVSAAAIAALRRIVQLSLASNLEVLQEFDQAKALLSALPAEEVDALNLLLQCLDLEMAAALCEKILTRIDHPAF